MYVAIFLAGYLVATVFSGWERQRFVETMVASNGVASLLRLGLSDQLDRLHRDLTAVARPLDAAQSKSQQAETAFAEIRAQLVGADKRIADIKAQYGNTSSEDEYLSRLLLDRFANAARAQQPPSTPQESRAEKSQPVPTAPAPVDAKETPAATPKPESSPAPTAPVDAKKP